MTVEELLEKFSAEKNNVVSAAAFLGIHPQTIRTWIAKKIDVPPQWEALYYHKKRNKK